MDADQKPLKEAVKNCLNIGFNERLTSMAFLVVTDEWYTKNKCVKKQASIIRDAVLNFQKELEKTEYVSYLELVRVCLPDENMFKQILESKKKKAAAGADTAVKKFRKKIAKKLGVSNLLSWRMVKKVSPSVKTDKRVILEVVGERQDHIDQVKKEIDQKIFEFQAALGEDNSVERPPQNTGPTMATLPKGSTKFVGSSTAESRAGHLIRKAWTFFNLMVCKNGEQSPVLDFTTSLQPIKMQYLLQCHIDTVNKHLNDTKYQIKTNDTGTAAIEVLSATDQQHDEILGEVVIALDEIAKSVYTKLFPIANEEIRLVLLQDCGSRLQGKGLDVAIYDDGKSSIVLVGQNECLEPAFDLLKEITDDKQKRTRSIAIDTKLNADLIHYLDFKNVLESKADVKVAIDFTDQEMTFANSSRDDIETYMQILQTFLSSIIVIKWVCPETVLKLLQLNKVRRYIQERLLQTQLKCFLDFDHDSSIVCYSLSSADGEDAIAMIKTSIQTIRIHKKSTSSCEVRDVMNKFNNKVISNTTEEDIVEVTATNDATAEIMLAVVQLDCPTEKTRASLQTGKHSENQSELRG